MVDPDGFGIYNKRNGNGGTGYFMPSASVNRQYVLPDKSGTVALLSDIEQGSPAIPGLREVADINRHYDNSISNSDGITLSVGGSNSNALKISNYGGAQGLKIENQAMLNGISIDNHWAGTGISCFNGSSGIGMHVNNYGGDAISISNENQGNAIRIYNTDAVAININSFAGSTGVPFKLTKDFEDKFTIDNDGALSSLQIQSLSTPPMSSYDTGKTGEIRIDEQFIYVCIAVNTWVRTALQSWESSTYIE